MMSKVQEDGSMSCIDSNYDECMYGALIQHMKAKTPNESCVVPWIMNGTYGVTDICKLPENINVTFWEAWNRVTNQLVKLAIINLVQKLATRWPI